MYMRAWLTPDSTLFSAPVRCREVKLPGDLIPYITGALFELTLPENWEAHGTATPTATAAFFYEVWEYYLNSMCAHVGEIRAFSYLAVPDGWIPMDGGSILAADYPDLAAVVPPAWLVGDDIFLPDMLGRALVGSGSGYTLGDIGGEESHVLTTPEIPAHTHTYQISVVTADIKGELPAPALDALAPASTGSAGSDQAHNNMPPYLAIVYAIFSGVL